MISQHSGKFIIFVLILIVCIPSLIGAQSLNQQLDIARKLENQGRIQDALELMETLYNNHPENASVFSRYASVLMKSRHYTKLLSLINEKEERGRSIPDNTILKARVIYRQGRYDQAMQAWNSLLRKYPQNRIMYYKVASSMINERLLEEALQVYLEGRKTLNDNDLYSINIVNVYEALLKFEKATKELLQYLEHNPKRYAVVEAKLHRFKGSSQIVSTVSASIKEAIKKQPHNKQLKKLLVRYYIGAEYFQEGWDAARKFFPSDKKENENILFLFAENAYKAGSPAMAEKAYRKILQADSILIPVGKIYFGLAQTLEVQKKYEKAIQYYDLASEKLKNSSAALQSRLQKAGILKEVLNEFEKAEKTYRSLISQPLNPQQLYNCHFSLGECLIAQRKIKEAEETYLRTANEFSEEKNTYWIKAIVSLGRMYYFKGEFDTSLTYLNQLSSTDINEEYLSEESLNDGLELRMLIKQNFRKSKKPLRFLARAEYHVEMREYEKAVAVLDSLIEGFSDSTLIRYGLFKKGRVLIQLQKYKASIDIFEDFIERYPADKLTDQAMERAGWVYQKVGNPEKAVAFYENLLTNFPHSLLKEDVRIRIRSIEEEQ